MCKRKSEGERINIDVYRILPTTGNILFPATPTYHIPLECPFGKLFFVGPLYPFTSLPPGEGYTLNYFYTNPICSELLGSSVPLRFLFITL